MQEAQMKFGNTTTFRAGVFFALLCALTYGLNPVIAKLAYAEGLQGMEIFQYRFLFASVVLALVGPLLDKNFYHIQRHTGCVSLVIALAIMLPLNLLYIYALRDIPASMMSLITYIYPLVVLVIGRLFFGECVRKSQIISVVMIILGCLCIFKDSFESSIGIFALALAFLSMVMYAIYLVAFQRMAQGESTVQLTFLIIVICTVTSFLLNNPAQIFSLTSRQIFLCFVYGLVSTVLATVFLLKAIQCVGATETGIFCSFEPVFTIAFSVVLLGEEIPLYRYLGMALLIVGIVWPNIKRLRTKCL